MNQEILVVWWTALAAALIVTIVDVYLLMLVVHQSGQIKALTAATLKAAGGIAANTAAGAALGETVQLVTALVNKTSGLDPLTAAVVRRLAGAQR